MHRALGSCPITSTVVLRSTNTCFLPTRSRGTNTAVCPSCQSNVAKCQDKGSESDYFLSSQDKIQGQANARINARAVPCQRLSTRWTISTISNRCWKHFTRSSLSKNVLITQRKYACQIQAIWLKYRAQFIRRWQLPEAGRSGPRTTGSHFIPYPFALYPF